MKLARYQTRGFIPINEPPARRRALAATVTIYKGDAIQDNASGYKTNAAALFTQLFMGVAAAPVVGDSSTKYVEYYPFDTKTQYSVPVKQNAVITIDAVGSCIQLETAGGYDVDISDTDAEGIVFRVDDFDASAAAILANAYGYAIGHFEVVGTQA